MPELESKYFGRIQYHEESLIEFPVGLPGFEQERWFLLIEQPVNRPLIFMQSVKTPSLCFLTLPVKAVVSDYRIPLSAEEASTLGMPEEREAGDGSETLCLGIVAVAQNGSATINLRAPLVVRYTNRRAVQAIPDESSYSHQHPLDAQGGPCS